MAYIKNIYGQLFTVCIKSHVYSLLCFNAKAISLYDSNYAIKLQAKHSQTVDSADAKMLKEGDRDREWVDAWM